MKKTKIICTMGPNTEDEQLLKRLVEAGMDVARFNFSHGSYEDHKRRMDKVKRVREETGVPIALMLDTRGPEIRTGLLKNGKSVEIQDGAEFIFTTKEIEGDSKRVSVTYENLHNELKKGDIVLVDDGLLKFEVMKIQGTEIICHTIHGGVLFMRKGVNIPNVKINLPAITQKDKEDILFGIEQDIDYIAASFIRSASAVLEIKAFLKEHHAEHIDVISKLENAQGVDNMEEIIAASDGIMVARGDMGVEIPVEKVPHIQKQLIQKCKEQFKPVITATQMLDSMIRNPSPTRAEVTDVANAIYDGTDAIMLSGESAVGKYPVESVEMMREIAEETEQYIEHEKYLNGISIDANRDISKAVGYASVLTAKRLHAKYIVTPSISGFTTRIISKLHPGTPIIGMSPNAASLRKMQLYWGVYPLASTMMQSESDLVERSINILKNLDYVHHDDRIVITAGIVAADSNHEVGGLTNTMRVAMIK